jgi:hypothetical protein
MTGIPYREAFRAYGGFPTHETDETVLREPPEEPLLQPVAPHDRAPALTHAVPAYYRLASRARVTFPSYQG